VRTEPYRVHCADVSDLLPTLEAESFDAVLCDPPYGLSFMGKQWDHGVPSAEVWSEVLRVLKPGGHLIAFGGTRTFHRLTCAIEDAGFEIRDCLAWLYGQGFPKSLDISKALDKAAGAEREVIGPSAVHSRGATTAFPKRPGERDVTESGRVTEQTAERAVLTAPATDAARQWQGYGTALKPAWEPAILAMKPTVGTFAENALAHGVAGINVDGCRIGTDGATKRSDQAPYPRNADGKEDRSGSWARTGHAVEPLPLGRWPANVALDEEAAAMLDEQSGEVGGGRFTNGGASRFFYVSKASRREREAGLEGLPRNGRRVVMASSGRTMIDGEWVETHSEPIPRTNHHPTVKPIRLAEWLARLLLPPKRDMPRRLLVPFSGSGSEMIGALLAGWDEVVGIEREAEYVEIAEARLAHWAKDAEPQADLFAERTA